MSYAKPKRRGRQVAIVAVVAALHFVVLFAFFEWPGYRVIEKRWLLIPVTIIPASPPASRP